MKYKHVQQILRLSACSLCLSRDTARPRAVLAAVLCTALSGPSHALTLTLSDFPEALVECSNAVTCAVDSQSIADSGRMSAFNMFRFHPEGYHEMSWLIRYQLDAPSARTVVLNGAESAITPYVGYLWLEAPHTLSMDGQNLFRVYTDQVSPATIQHPEGLSYFVFGMEAVAAINGGATFFRDIRRATGEPTTYGDLVMYDEPLTCADCGIDVWLNLIGLQYDTTGTAAIHLTDSRALVLQYSTFGDEEDTELYPFINTHAFHVQAVPLPAAAWLFGWGVVALGLIGWRRA